MKKLFSISFVLFFILSSSYLFAQVAIQSGTFSANTSTPGYTLDKNSGDRSVTIEVNFDKPFDKKPTVVLAVVKLDADNKTNLRYNIETLSVSRDAFTVKISTWSEGKIYGIGGSWIAYSN
jgi:hypothetical protein